MARLRFRGGLAAQVWDVVLISRRFEPMKRLAAAVQPSNYALTQGLLPVLDIHADFLDMMGKAAIASVAMHCRYYPAVALRRDWNGLILGGL